MSLFQHRSLSSTKKSLAAKRVMNVEGFLLHRYSYKETSSLLDVFTREYGRVTLLAKGAKRPHSALRPVLLNFQNLSLAWSGAQEIKTLTHAETMDAPRVLKGSALMSAWYLNELLLRFLPKEDAHERLFDFYHDTLVKLSNTQSVALVLREFEWFLLREVGYGFDPLIVLDGSAIEPTSWYSINPAGGVERLSQRDNAELSISAEALWALHRGIFEDVSLEPQLRRILRLKLNYHMNGKPLETRRILKDLHTHDKI